MRVRCQLQILIARDVAEEGVGTVGIVDFAAVVADAVAHHQIVGVE